MTTPSTPAGTAETHELSAYDAGLLNDFGGGNVEWWQDYIRAELERAHVHYTDQHDALSAENERLTAERDEAISDIRALTAELNQCRKEKNDLVLKAYPAMDQRDRFKPAIIAAFGLLWRDTNAGQLAIEARKALSAVLTQEEKAGGINEALGRYGDPHEGDVMAAVDRAFPPEYIREAARADRAESAREQAEAALAEVRDESWRTGPVPHGTQYIIVRETRSYRWLPYKGKSEQFRKGIKGRWQRATEYGWENAPIPDGADWRTMEQSPAAAASPHPTAESDE
jgi:hypothetical protein